MNVLRRAAGWLARKAYTFSTSNYDGNWYKSNGYYAIAQAGYGYGRDRALQLAALFGGLKIIGEDMGSIPLHTSRKNAAGEWNRDEDHPLYPILHDAPNPETTAVEFREAMTAQAVLYGASYAKIVRNLEGAVVALWQVQPESVRREKNQYGATYYIIKHGDGSEESIDRDSMFVLRGFGMDGEAGADLLHIARQTIGLSLDQQAYATSYFSQDQKPPFYIKFPGTVGGPEGVKNLKEAWARDRFENPKSPSVLQEGAEIHELRPDNEKAQLIEQRRFQIAEVCRLIRLSPHKLADLERATFSNIENLNIHHYTETLRPYAVRWEQAISLRLLVPEERRIVKAEHAVEGFLRGDFRTQTDGFARLLEKGVYSINEVRNFLGKNAVENGDGHNIQLNMREVGEAAAEEPVQVQDPSGKTIVIPIKRLKEFFPEKSRAGGIQ